VKRTDEATHSHPDVYPDDFDPPWFRIIGWAVYGALWVVIYAVVRPVDRLLRWR
jgi:hypothetical protein